MEDYAAKMLPKSDAALREYVTGYAQYREAAVLAAFDELRARGQPAPEEEALRPALEAAAATQRQADEAAEAIRLREDAAANPAVADASSPALYSQVTILLFSLSTMFVGGVLMGLNLYRLGQKRAVLGLVLFVAAYLYIGSLLLTLAMTRLGLSPFAAMILFNLPAALVYIRWFWPRYVGTMPFRSRSVLLPLLIYMLLAWGSVKLVPYLMQKQPKEVRQQWERMMPR